MGGVRLDGCEMKPVHTHIPPCQAEVNGQLHSLLQVEQQFACQAVSAMNKLLYNLVRA